MTGAEQEFLRMQRGRSATLVDAAVGEFLQEQWQQSFGMLKQQYCARAPREDILDSVSRLMTIELLRDELRRAAVLGELAKEKLSQTGD